MTQYRILHPYNACICFSCSNTTLLLTIHFPSYARLPGTAEGWFCVVACPPSRGSVTLNTTTQNLTLAPGIDGCHLPKTLQSLSASMASNPVPPLPETLFFQALSSFRLFLSYFCLVSTFPWRRLSHSHSHSRYLTLQGSFLPSQQVSSKPLFAHCL